MSAVATVNPYTLYLDTSGKPLDSGFLYFGQPFQDPEQFPIPVFWDENGTIPAQQPIRTVSGYPVRNGSPAVVYAAAQYSLRVLDKDRRQVFYNQNVVAADLSGGGYEPRTAAAGQTVFNLATFTYEPGANALDVHMNGLLLTSGVDYLETDASTVTLVNPAGLNDQLIFQARNAFSATQAGLVDFQSRTFNGAGGPSQNFVLASSPGSVNNVWVSVAGAVLRPSVDFTLSGSTVTVTPGPTVGVNNVLIRWGRSLPQDALRADLADTTNPANGAALVANAAIRVDDITALRALAAPSRKTVVYVEGYYTPNDGGGGAFLWIPASTKADNGGTVIQPNSLPANGRWERDADSISVKWFGAVGDGNANDTDAIQAAIDFVSSKGGGIVFVPAGEYSLGPSTTGETFDNFGAAVAASTGCIVNRSSVYLVGEGCDAVLFKPTLTSLTCIFVVSPEFGGISGLSIDGQWAGSGSGHGIFTVNVAAGVDEFFRNYKFDQLIIKNVGSYAIGIQNGDIKNVSISRLKTENTGADGIDIKNRGPSKIAEGIFIDDVFVEQFGMRLDGCAGVDMRGIVRASKIHVSNYGRVDTTQTAIRFRNASSPTDEANRYSAVDNFYTQSNGLGTTVGVENGSAYTHISAGVVRDASTGIQLSGNANGNADFASVLGVTAIDCTTFGFRTTSGTDNTKYVGCSAVNCATGFRDEGSNTSYILCDAPGSATPASTSGGAAPSQIAQACRFGANGITESSSSGRVDLQATGTDTNIDLRLAPKGAAYVRFGTRTASGDAAVTGYIEIKDDTGAIRRLAVIG